MVYYRCKCRSCNYETAYDMTAGTAIAAAVMHVMLGPEHLVEVSSPGGAVQLVTQETGNA